MSIRRMSFSLPATRGGMTLLEILLAMAVLAMVVAMVSLSLSGSLDAIEKTRTEGELYYRAQITLERISEDLGSAFLTDDIDFVGTAGEGGGEPVELLRFGSMAHIVFDPARELPGLGRITYTLAPDNEGTGFILYRRDTLFRPGEQENTDQATDHGFRLCDRVRSLTFEYVDREGGIHDSWNGGEVTDTENRTSGLPAAVNCVLELWLDREKERFLTFSTRILLPTGLLQGQQVDEGEG
ncbi:PulJ/GspJ family protein [Desulfolithobacter sp.]